MAGCEETRKDPFAAQIQVLREEKQELQKEVEGAEAEIAELPRRIGVLSGLRGEVKPEDVYEVQRIKITRYTNLYDKDKDGTLEKLIVYVQPIDDEGDVIKAGGSLDVQLWDLNKEGDEALLGQWHVGAEEVRKQWYTTIMKVNYRLKFNVSDKIKSFDEPLTVKVTFTDYLSGRVFKEQKVIKP